MLTVAFLDLHPFCLSFNVHDFSDWKFSARNDDQNELKETNEECNGVICHVAAIYEHFVGVYETLPEIVQSIGMPQSIVLLISISVAIFLLVFLNIFLALFGHGHFIYGLVGYGLKCLENWSTCPLLTSEIWFELGS